MSEGSEVGNVFQREVKKSGGRGRDVRRERGEELGKEQRRSKESEVRAGRQGRQGGWEEMLFGWEMKEQERCKWREREKERGLPKIQEERKNPA